MKEGSIRRAEGRGPMFDEFNLEIYFRGEWVHFGSVGSLNNSNLYWQNAYRAVCKRTVDRFIEGQVRLGMTSSAQYFEYNVTAHVVTTAERPGMWALCGQRLSSCQDELELLAERRKERRWQKMCTRCETRRANGEK